MLKLLKLERLEVRKVSEVTPNLLEGEKFSLTQPTTVRREVMLVEMELQKL